MPTKLLKQCINFFYVMSFETEISVKKIGDKFQWSGINTKIFKSVYAYFFIIIIYDIREIVQKKWLGLRKILP